MHTNKFSNRVELFDPGNNNPKLLLDSFMHPSYSRVLSEMKLLHSFSRGEWEGLSTSEACRFTRNNMHGCHLFCRSQFLDRNGLFFGDLHFLLWKFSLCHEEVMPSGRRLCTRFVYFEVIDRVFFYDEMNQFFSAFVNV